MAGVSVSAVSKSFGVTEVLKDVSLEVRKGEFVSLVGPSGCGKTTLMRIIAGLETASSGMVTIEGRDVTNIRAADRDVAMVFQNYALYPHLTVSQNLAVPLVMRRLSALQRMPLFGRFIGDAKAKLAAISDETKRTAEMLGIAHLMDRKPAQLSGGQRQRVALGRAIVRHPRVFLMDEPLSNLDAALRVHTRAEIVALHRRVGAATVYVTHDQSEAMTMSDRVAVMMGGEILQIAAPEEIYLDPADLRVASFIGSPKINVLAAEADERGRVSVDGVPTGLLAPSRGPVTFAVRPEDIAPAGDGIPARLTHVEFLGDCALLHAETIGNKRPVICRVAPDRRPRVAIGGEISLWPDAAKSFLFDGNGKRVSAAVAKQKPAHV
ncbi:MAG: ABC transporter ATP-binding protein [Methylocystis sp.]|nr:ABC transporter ATP-binding protein [Methylocystis sp.]MCA3582202.1 ABC transporter ATP-binding protein [Methylocystis sp.]MCA3587906.1 ABC transporter ATP-binding protein [Methylocystis sp.]MCA3590263.1 ABC transporter ATP-binding protein [Methylocystis sp.]